MYSNDYSDENYIEFKDKPDEEVVLEAQKGNNRAQEYLIAKYENFVKSKAKSYFLITSMVFCGFDNFSIFSCLSVCDAVHISCIFVSNLLCLFSGNAL